MAFVMILMLLIRNSGSIIHLIIKAFDFKYDGEFNHITHNIDLLLKGRVGVPEVNNFFGLGNTTEISDEKNYDFYKTHFKLTELQVLFRQRVFERLQLIAGPYFL